MRVFNKEKIKFEIKDQKKGTNQTFSMSRTDLETQADEMEELKAALELYSEGQVVKTTVKKSHLYLDEGGDCA